MKVMLHLLPSGVALADAFNTEIHVARLVLKSDQNCINSCSQYCPPLPLNRFLMMLTVYTEDKLYQVVL